MNETLWNSSAGGYLASLFYGKAAPDSDEIEYATAGAIQIILVGKSGVEVIRPEASLLGAAPAIRPDRARVDVRKGDVLLVLSSSSQRPSLALELARQLRAHRDATADELLRLVRSIDRQAALALILQRRQR